MKHILIGLCCVLGMSSCGRTIVDPPDPTYPASKFGATVNGKTFIADDMTAYTTATGLTIMGASNSGTSKQALITLVISNFAGPATYTIDSLTTATYSEPAGNYRGTSGEIVITASNSSHTAGTFSFDAESGTAFKSVTKGSFDIYKQ